MIIFTDSEAVTKETLEYLLATEAISGVVTEAFTTRGELLEQFSYWNNDHVKAFAMSGIVLKQAYSSAKELKPPQTLTSIHNKMLKGFKLYADSVDIANKGIDTSNPELIEEAIALVEEGSVWITRATEELEAIAKKLEER